MHIITLVHGTWGKKTAWAKLDSALSQAINHCFGEAVSIAAFPWSGRNSHAARQRAANELRQLLLENVSAHPDAKHYLICHSHGGLVALYAIRDIDPLAKLNVICMATPFLVARERDLEKGVLHDSIAAFCIIGLLLGFAAAFLLTSLIGAYLESFPVAARVGFLIPLWLAGFVLPNVLLLVARSWWEHFAHSLSAELRLPAISPDQLLIIRSCGDEATGSLLFLQILCQLSIIGYSGFVRLRAKVVAFIEKVTSWHYLLVVSLVATMVVPLLFITGHLSGFKDSFASPTTFLQTVVIFVLILVIVLVRVQPVVLAVLMLVGPLFIWPLIAFISLLLLPGFGVHIALSNILLDVTVESTPVGEWKVHLFNPQSMEELGIEHAALGAKLMHTVIYRGSPVSRLICAWIADRARVENK